MRFDAFYYLACLIVLLCLLRSVLIVMGFYKDPILRSFEEYGSDRLYSPLLGLGFWLFISFLMFLFLVLNPGNILMVCIFLLIPAVWVHQRIDEFVQNHRTFFSMYPHWYRHVLRTTSREEQQRIAYMWLRLPWRTRILYNTHDAFFHQWTDLVLLSIV